MKSMQLFRVGAASVLVVALGSAVVGWSQKPMADGQLDEVRQEKQPLQLAMLAPMISEDGPGQEAQQRVMLQLMAADGQVVKGKQYSADASTETVQTLGDGNRIVHRTVSKFYRDSEGRTRREETFGNVDTEHPTPHEVKVFIDDPVSGTSYVLDPGSKSTEKVQHSVRLITTRSGNDEVPKTSFKMTFKDDEDAAQDTPGHMLIKIRDEHLGDPTDDIVIRSDEKRSVAKEDLGVRNIEGVDCDGTRKTITIPAGEVGNEKPISIVTETWFAPSIAAVVQSTTDDPRYGKTTYQLTNVQTTEPARSLFDPPADFKMDVRK
jgi:hypothetical protein